MKASRWQAETSVCFTFFYVDKVYQLSLFQMCTKLSVHMKSVSVSVYCKAEYNQPENY